MQSPHPPSAAVLCDQPVEDALPQQMYLEYFSPDYRLNYNRRPVRFRADRCVPGVGPHSHTLNCQTAVELQSVAGEPLVSSVGMASCVSDATMQCCT